MLSKVTHSREFLKVFKKCSWKFKGLENEYSGYNDACKLDKIKGFLDDTVINKFCQILYYRFLIKRYNYFLATLSHVAKIGKEQTRSLPC